MNKYRINIATISIGIDFFQVLFSGRTRAAAALATPATSHRISAGRPCVQVVSMFGDSKIPWSPAIKNLYALLSSFAL